MATNIDLRAAGSQTTIDGAIFQDSANIGSGTGGYNTFLAISPTPSQSGNEQGFNSDQTPPIDDSNTDIDHSKTHTVLLSTVPVTVVNGVQYYEFRVDLNESNSNPNGQISLDQFKIYSSTNGGIVDTTTLFGQTLEYDMDAGAQGDVSLLLSEVSTGSGTDDYAVLVPVSKFAGLDPATTYMYLYVDMGSVGGEFEAAGGFEEWNLQSAGTLTGTKFEDLDGDGVRDAGEPGMADVTIFIDNDFDTIVEATDNNGVLDPGERSTTTDANGNYTFYGVPLGTWRIDEVVPSGSTQTTGPFETATLSTVGQSVVVDPIGNFVPRPALNITKDATVPGGTANVAGEKISYTITVANTGNTTLTGVVVTDPFADAGSITRVADVSGDNDVLLEIGETWGFTAEHTVTQAEIDSNGGGDGLLENTATADSNETGPDTDDASVPVARNPALNITKDATVPGGTANVAGEVISYTITVANTGNTTLTGVLVTDPFADAGSITRVTDVSGDNDALLEVGETWGFTAEHTVTQAEIDSNGGGDGLLENTATADSNETGPDTDDASVPVARNPALNITKDATVPGGTADTAGEKISYTITVANTGNTTLTGVVVTDPFADAGSITRVADVSGDNDALLEVGETWGFTAEHTVTQAEIDSFGGGDGLLENTATADSNETGPDTDDASVPVAALPSLNITKDATVPGGTANVAGEKISYTITVANTGNTTLTGVVVTDPFADAGSITRVADVSGDNDALLEIGETWGFTAEHTVTQAEIDTNGGGDGLLENTATADSNETGPDTDDASVPVARNPALNITKDATVPGGTADAAGEVISYTITVANTGNTTLTGVAVTDPFADAGSITRVADVSGDNDALLEVGETWGFTAAHTVTQAEIDSNGGGDGLLENTATADSNETGPDTDDASVPVARNPALNITKSATVPGGTADTAGEKISYTITVQNTGNITLSNVTVTDPFADAGSIVRGLDVVGDNDALLEVGETWGYTAEHTVTQAEIDNNGGGDGLLENIATADSDETDPDTDDASVPVEQRPALNITKDATVPGGTADTAGEKISYTITVQNTGNTTLSNVTVTDPFADAGSIVRGLDVVGDNDALLEVGETWGYTAEHTVTQAEIDNNGGGDGLLENIATADSDETDPDTDDASVPVEQRPALNITKDATVPGGTADTAGEKISYTITVANTGNTTLTGVAVTDPYADAGSIVRGLDVVGDNDALLEVGETWGFTAEHTVTQAEIDDNGGGDGQLENTATADSNETGPDTDDASVPVEQRPGISIVKTATIQDDHADQAGDVIHYTVVVDNTGNVSLHNVVVTDTFEGGAPVILDTDGSTPDTADDAVLSGDDGDGILQIDETWTYTYSHVVTQNELDTRGIDGDGSLDNVASVTSDETGPESDDASIPILLGPGVRTPGFWSQNTGQNKWTKFWDGIEGNEPKQSGTDGFPDGEITYAVDSNHDGFINGSDAKGLLVGDFNLDGIENNGEHVLFISTADALTLLNASQKQQGDARYVLGRDTVASWLNYLAGNGIGDDADTNSPRHYLDDSAQWLNFTTNGDDTLTISELSTGKVPTNSATWQTPSFGLDHSASQLHSGLDEYNNNGTILGVHYAPTA